MEFESMRVLLTGATGGIGSALASSLIGKGASALLQGRDPRALTTLAELLSANRCSTVAGDLTDDGDLIQIKAAAEAFRVNVLVNNAGINEFTLFANANVEQIVSTNVTATMRLTQTLLPHLLSLERGLIVNVGSTFGAIGYPGYVTYSASKFAIRGFSEALRRELMDTAVDVIYAAPRATATAMNTEPARSANQALRIREDSPHTVAREILGAMSRRRPRLQIGWPEKLNVRINALFPALVDSAISRQLDTIKRFAP